MFGTPHLPRDEGFWKAEAERRKERAGKGGLSFPLLDLVALVVRAVALVVYWTAFRPLARVFRQVFWAVARPLRQALRRA